MPVRAEILKALADFIANEGGMKFQHLAVALGRMRWPELIASERRADLGLDAYASALLSADGVGKGLASSTTPTLEKIVADAERATKHYGDLKSLIFVTPDTVSRKKQGPWVTEIRSKYGLELTVIEREDIVTSLMLPAGVMLCRNFLHLDIPVEPGLAEEVARIKAAVAESAANLAARVKGPMIALRAHRLEANGAEAVDVFTVNDIRTALCQNRRIVLEAPAGRGKTTTLVQLASDVQAGQIPIFIDLPGWVVSGRGILEFISGTPQFQAQGLDAGALARAQTAEQLWFLLNGWNEVAESSSERAEQALRDLDLHFPRAGIVVATRMHHLVPPLPGAVRLRLLPLLRRERAAYLAARLAAKARGLQALLDAKPVLDDLTRTPFILSEVASLFEAGVPIPETKMGVLGAVTELQEKGEHRNALQGAPLFGRASDYLEALATEMTRRGAVSLPEEDARAITVAVATDLASRNQIADVREPAAVLAALSAHHVLERADYPGVSFRFGHQQFQERYAALGIAGSLFALAEGDADGLRRYTSHYVNEPAWAESLRMVAETLGIATGHAEADKRQVRAGRELLEMALAVDIVFAGELAHLCGAAVGVDARQAFGGRLRALHAGPDARFRDLAVAAMLATGSDDFQDIVAPLLSSADRETRLGTYRLWPDFSVSSLGPEWRKVVSAWPDDVRADFVSEMLHNGLNPEAAAFAAADKSAVVKTACAEALAWTGSDDALASVLGSMDAPAFEAFALDHIDQVPAALRANAVAALKEFIAETKDELKRLRTALNLIEAGEVGWDDVVKGALAALRPEDMRNAESHYIQPAVEHLHKADPAWVSEWLAVQVGEGVLYHADHWLTFAPAVPEALVDKYVGRLETEDLKHARFEGMIRVIAGGATPTLAARIYAKVRELRGKVEAEPETRPELEWAILRQLEAAFRALPDDVAVAGILASITGTGEPIDIIVAAHLLRKVGRRNDTPLQLGDLSLKARLRKYLKGNLETVLKQDDFDGQDKANLASALAQLGHAEDMPDLVTLIKADIERVRRGRKARADGDRGPLGNGGSMSYSGWHVEAVLQLDPAGAQQVLVGLLPQPEYAVDAAQAMARDFHPKPERAFDRKFRYELMWAAREGLAPALPDNARRERYAEALNAEIARLLMLPENERPMRELKELAKALAAIDGGASAAVIVEVMALPASWDEYTRADAVELLLASGVVVPSAAAFGIVDSILKRSEKYGLQDSEKYLFQRAVALCAFVDEPAKGVAKMREAITARRLYWYDLREIVIALGESRSDAALDYLLELASDPNLFEACEENLINAFAALDTPRAREVLLGLIEPGAGGITLPPRPHREDVLVARISDLAWREPAIARRLIALCERDLPDLNRHLLCKVMNWLGTAEARAGALNLIDDSKGWGAIPWGVRELLEGAFVERRPYGDSPGVFTQHARASNELRTSLFKMANRDAKRRKSAFGLLGQIEEWRLERGRPAGEPRHPDFQSGSPWPPMEPA
ncbi:MAG: hypothetical protein GEV06_17125 [Luteitalea sp.]|nr:hypothetical protein [Luteitalea sp.]